MSVAPSGDLNEPLTYSKSAVPPRQPIHDSYQGSSQSWNSLAMLSVGSWPPRVKPPAMMPSVMSTSASRREPMMALYSEPMSKSWNLAESPMPSGSNVSTSMVAASPVDETDLPRPVARSCAVDPDSRQSVLHATSS